MGSMDQQGLHGEIEGCSRPSDRKVSATTFVSRPHALGVSDH